MKQEKLILVATLLLSVVTVKAQSLHSAYFTNEYHFRHAINPAFGNEQNYISIPALGNLSIRTQGNFGYDAVIILGSVIRGETPHFDYICQGVTQGVARMNATNNIPVVFGLLTTDNLQQAKDRAGGRLGNKGDECAVVAIKMAKF